MRSRRDQQSLSGLFVILVLVLLLSSSTIKRITCYAFQAPNPSHLHQKHFQSSPLFLSDFNNKKRSGYTTDLGYDQFLRKRLFRRIEERLKLREQRRKENMEDGYEDMMLIDKRRSPLRAMLKLPVRVAKRILTKPHEPGTLILIRHGESVWNANQTFTGWADPDLSERGFREAEHAARLLLEGGFEIDVVFTSRLKRAIRTVWIILTELNEVYLPVFKSWRLQERHYGALTGLSKKELAEQLGADLVQTWRGSYEARPPPLTRSDAYWPGHFRRYADLRDDQLPLTESLKDCMERTQPVWKDRIQREIRLGRNVLVVAHANTLRGLVKTIDEISDEDIKEVTLPTGIPVIYKFDKNLRPIKPDGPSQIHTNGLFLEKPGLLKEALEREEEWSNNVPGYDYTMGRTKIPMTSLERSLFKLKAERELGQWAGQFIDKKSANVDDGSDGNQGKPIVLSEDKVWEQAMEEIFMGTEQDNNQKLSPTIISQNAPNPCVTALPPTKLNGGVAPTRTDAVLVMIRHGKTEHNKLGLFTGWEDVPLAKEGIEEAKNAGRLLKLHGFEFDVVYTSWLSRAIETAWHVLDELDELWIPLIKTWRLNERMYGVLTGLSKRMVAQRHGEAQFKAWRRGYNTAPPRVSSFSKHYPGNDKRYQKYLKDVRYSVTESLIRSIESGRLCLRRKLPKSESLKMCMDRTIPYYTERIVPEALAQGQRVLISSSENAIRGLLMHLCEIPEDQITGLEIPNGLPLIFDLNSKCIKLLDDGTGRDPLEVYNFGKAAKYLFRPCQNEDGSPDEECDVRFMSDFQSQSSKPIISEADQKSLDEIRSGGYGVRSVNGAPTRDVTEVARSE